MASAYTNQMTPITATTGRESLRRMRRGRRLNLEPHASLAPFSARSMASVWRSGMDGAGTISLRRGSATAGSRSSTCTYALSLGFVVSGLTTRASVPRDQRRLEPHLQLAPHLHPAPQLQSAHGHLPARLDANGGDGTVRRGDGRMASRRLGEGCRGGKIAGTEIAPRRRTRGGSLGSSALLRSLGVTEKVLKHFSWSRVGRVVRDASRGE